MSTPAQQRILVDTGALAVAEDGDRTIVFDRGTSGLATTAFVLGIVAVVVGGFGLAALFLDAGISTLVAAAMAAVGVVLAALTAWLIRKIMHRRRMPLHECRTVAVLDRRRGLFSAAGGGLMELQRVQFARRMQLTSSSPKLVAVTPGGTVVLKRGNPFDGGIGNVDEVLNASIASAP